MYKKGDLFILNQSSSVPGPDSATKQQIEWRKKLIVSGLNVFEFISNSYTFYRSKMKREREKKHTQWTQIDEETVRWLFFSLCVSHAGSFLCLEILNFEKVHNRTEWEREYTHSRYTQSNLLLAKCKCVFVVRCTVLLILSEVIDCVVCHFWLSEFLFHTFHTMCASGFENWPHNWMQSKNTHAHSCAHTNTWWSGIFGDVHTCAITTNTRNHTHTHTEWDVSASLFTLLDSFRMFGVNLHRHAYLMLL